MSRLEELIAKLRPEEVEYRKVEDIANISRGKVMSKDFIKENAGEYPVYSSQTENDGKLGAITTYMFDGEYLTWTTDGANAGTVFYRSGRFNVTNVCGVIDNISKDVDTKYLYYVLNREAPHYVYRTKCFLTSEEKVFWVAYIIIQILRLPQILDLAERTSLEILGKQININQAQNIAKRFCLPFFEEMKEDSQETAVFNALFDLMKNMSFAVGVDKRARIITSDKPVHIYSKEYPCEEYERIIFPITSEICLFMFGGEDKKRYPKNSLFPIGDDGREEILKSMADSSFGKIYSNHLLDKKEKKFVEEVLIEKEAKTCPTLTL